MTVSTVRAASANLTPSDGVRMLHVACWRALALSTVDPMVGPVAYVIDFAKLTECEQARSVTCGVCGDAWILGVFAHPEVVARVRRLVLRAGIA